MLVKMLCVGAPRASYKMLMFRDKVGNEILRNLIYQSKQFAYHLWGTARDY